VANIVLESSYPWQLKVSLYSEIVAGDDQRAPELKLSMNKQTAKMTKLISIMDFMPGRAQGQGHYWTCINSLATTLRRPIFQQCLCPCALPYIYCTAENLMVHLESTFYSGT
jgi:hypothetical protein